MRNFWLTFYFLYAVALTGCADSVRDSYANLHTKIINGFQDSSVGISPGVEKIAKLENLKVEKQGSTFSVSGFVTYSKSCKFLKLDVKFLAKDSSVLGNAPGIVQNYAANDRSKFKALFSNLPTSSSEYLDVARIDALSCL